MNIPQNPNGQALKANSQPFTLASDQATSLTDGVGGIGLGVAMMATNFVVSTANSTTTQLASLATFTGAAEICFNQQAISMLLVSDQPGVLTLFQYIDAAGTKQISAYAYTIQANISFSRSVVANGNFYKVTFKNNGGSTTTTLDLNVALGTLPASTNLGNGPVSLDEVNGVPMFARADGTLRTLIDPTTLLYDPFETLDTVNTWVIGGTTSPTGTAGQLTLAPGTTANGSSFAKSIPSFTPSSNGWLQYASVYQIEAAAVTGNKRLWGLGIYVTPTFAVPITNGAVFEILDTTGALHASIYSNSVKTTTIALTRPIDGLQHRYAILYRGSRVYFEIDGQTVAVIQNPGLQVSALSLVSVSFNGGTAVATAPTLISTLNGLADTGRNATKVADGLFPWRTQRVDTGGSAYTTKAPVLFKGRANSFRIPGRAGTTGQNLMSIHNATGSTINLQINKITVDLMATAVIAVTVIPPIIRMWKVTVLPTNGTAVTKTKIGGTTTSNASVTVLNDASADGTGSATTLTTTRPAGTYISQEFAPRLITAAGYEPGDRMEFFGDTEVVLGPLEGIVIFLDYTTAAANPTTNSWIVGIEWEEKTP